MTIGVTGANGQLGRLVVDKLKNAIPVAEIIALVRSPEKAADLQRISKGRVRALLR